ncbi:Dolichyl-phosphate-mannose-protein mannosyltransferase [Caulifigura coniformis]|uniref:Dolichyl-phosphate-mannose-protein mannosyltransferase n=1 Tax=Caulifigura coniformis TaxID=2527983 RepID=A0A517SD29_9PLAN|nr:glycosyltransferase family 39 protein [Caulifigura coniformis]QDT54028.1 Dolichyl-phosphate-mannose-protein mannosyltransferase [Caulifigura coniformis]
MSPRPTRLEIALVVAVFAAGFGLRAAVPARMAVEHFDEGVYASNLYTPDGRYPFQHLYAPPLLPFCLEWAAIFGGPQGVMWVNVVSGSLTLLVVWGMVRAWWGPPAAMAAMVLLAFNEFHIAYSRAALTDAMLGLWMTAGVWAGWRAVQSGGAGNIVAAGVLASLAWWTKYNGWLTLAITGAGTAGWIVFGGAGAIVASGRQPPDPQPSPSRSKKRVKSSAGSGPPLADAPKSGTVFGAAGVCLGRWGLTAGIAFLLWAPWLWELQKYGGYSAVAKNHAGYFTGLGQWWPNAVRQVAALAHDNRLLTKLSPFPALLFATVILSSQLIAFEWRRLSAEARSDGRAEGDPVSANVTARSRLRELSLWLAAAWLIGLTVAVPLYTPYPRLGLTWIFGVILGLACLMATWLLPADWNASTLNGPSPDPAPPQGRWKRLGVFFAAFVVMVGAYAAFTGSVRGPYPAWENRSGLQSVSAEIVARLRTESLPREVEGVRCALYVLAEPGLYFHLAAGQRDSPVGYLTLAAADFDMTRVGPNQTEVPLYVVVGPHADQAEADRLIAAGRLEVVAEFDYRPSDLVLLDSRPAWELPTTDKPVVERVRLLHVKRD